MPSTRKAPWREGPAAPPNRPPGHRRGATPRTDRIPPGPRLKRAYEPPAGSDGTRVLVERLWPRGLRKAVARIDLWLKDIAPSPELRTWYGHDPAKWPEFQQRYRKELRSNPQAVQRLATSSCGHSPT